MSAPETLAELAQALDLTDPDIEDMAEHCAGQVRELAELWQAHGIPDAEALKALQRFARRRRVAFPTQTELAQILNRLTAAAWWRRALRKRFRTVEQHEIACGAVHRKASPYVSAKAMRRHERNARRLADLLASLECVNLDTGEALPLDDLIASSQANPTMRRMAMMARIRGIEAHATARGDKALFVTVTAPSRMHPRHESGQANGKHDGTTPRQAQTYLHGVWRNAMRRAAHLGLRVYGLRTVEPHHDGCPHWHVLLFTRPSDIEALLQTLRACALADSPNEPGADMHRFTAERIDPAKGSAAGYVAKYVAKSIDGHALDSDTESDDDGQTAAGRIVAWARLWGIRQFQFFGLPAITPTRELYRHDGQGLGSQALSQAHAACKAKDYAGYLAALESHSIDLDLQREPRPSSRYAGEFTDAIRGLVATAADLQAPVTLTTRTETWCIQPKPAQGASAATAAPWTRFNNCAGPLKSRTCVPSAALPIGRVAGRASGRWRQGGPGPSVAAETMARAGSRPEAVTC